jgi:protein-disulfide isomerase
VLLAAIAIAPVVRGADGTTLEGILAELKRIRQLLETGSVGRAAPMTSEKIVVEVTGRQRLGSADAPFAIVIFSDYHCQYCKQFFTTTFPDLKQVLVDSGKVAVYVRQLPLDLLKTSFVAAESALCAADQGKFWEMNEVLLAASRTLDRDEALNYATSLNLDSNSFRSCLDGRTHKSRIEHDIEEAIDNGVRGTPAFVLGRNGESSVEGELILGAVPLGIFERKIAQLSKLK